MSTEERSQEHKSKLRRTLSKWASSEEAHNRELKQEVRRVGCCPVAEAPDRTVIELHGTLRTVTLRPRGGTAALEAELFDGTGSLTLVWLGRRRIAGIEPGRALSVTGRVGRSTQDGRVMFNPRYQLTSA